LATILLTPWAVFQGAPDDIIERAEEEGDDDVLTDGGNALEVGQVMGNVDDRWRSCRARNVSSGVHRVRKS
jgi:hypothetical protein